MPASWSCHHITLRKPGIHAALAAVLCASPLPAAERWHKVTTPNFELYTTASAGRGKDAVQHFEQVRNFFIRTSNVKPPSGKPVRIIAFSSEKQYQPYRPREGAAAFYVAGVTGDTIVMGQLDARMFEVAIHEYVHLLIRHTKARYPLWLNEGTADLFSTLKPIAGKVKVGEFPAGRYQALRMARMLPLAQLAAVDHSSAHYNEKERASIFYGQSWALTHMLNFSKEYSPNYRVFLTSLLGGRPAEDAFRDAYSKGFPEVQRDLEGYIRQDSYWVGIVDAKLEKAAEAPEVAVPAEADVEFALAELLMDSRKREEAHLRYRDLAARFPERPEAHEALGYLELRGRNQAAAAGHFAKAADMGSRNPRMYYDWSWAAEPQPDSFPVVLRALRKAVELDPDFFDAGFRLGSYLLRHDRFGDALATLRQIKRVEPEHASRLFLAMAFCFDRLKMPGDARASADQARKYANNPADIGDADRFLAYLDRRDAAARLHRDPRADVASAAAPSSDAPPSLRRAERTPAPVDSGWTGPDPRGVVDRSPKVTGVLTQIECLGTNAKIHLETSDGPLAFWVEDPATIALRNAAGGAATIEFTCGPQPSTKVTVAYSPDVDIKRGAAGVVRLIEFQ